MTQGCGWAESRTPVEKIEFMHRIVPAHAGYPSIKKGGESAKPATNRKRTFITALNLKNITTKWTLLTPVKKLIKWGFLLWGASQSRNNAPICRQPKTKQLIHKIQTYYEDIQSYGARPPTILYQRTHRATPSSICSQTLAAWGNLSRSEGSVFRGAP